MKPTKRRLARQYDVCLSFAGEDRAPVKRLAKYLTDRGVRVFYDEYVKAELWGKDLYSHLDEIYQNAARYCLIFISKNYAKKLWTNHERQSAQARAIKGHSEYVLPVRIDQTKIPGIRDTTGYVDLKNTSIPMLGELVLKKIGPRQIGDYFPPSPDRLFKVLKVKRSDKKDEVWAAAHSFFDTLRRMNKTERRIVATIFQHGCPTELPENIHISLDLLRRVLRTSPTRLVGLVSKLGSLGFYWDLREGHGDEDDEPLLELEWHDMHVANSGNFTHVADAMFKLLTDGLCDECGRERLDAMDFGQLASSTRTKEIH